MMTRNEIRNWIKSKTWNRLMTDGQIDNKVDELEELLEHAQEQVKNIAYEPMLASVNSELKETYLRRIRTANEMIDNPDTSEEQKQRLRTKVSCYKYFVVELDR